MKKILKRIIQKNSNLYFFLYKLYMPFKKLKNRKRYSIHYKNFIKAFNDSICKKVIYIGIPTHNNLGDQAQYYCIKKYIKDNYPDFDIIEIIDDIIFLDYKKIISFLKRNMNKDDFFVFQSGYRTTDVANFGGEYAHQKILNNFKHKVIVFPQTVNFKNNLEKKKSIKAYQKNNNYIFLARDEISFETAKKMYDEKKVLLYPDIVTTLIGRKDFYENQQKDGILLCLRNDSEKLYSENDYKRLINQLKTISNNIAITDTNSLLDLEFNKDLVEGELKEKINQFSKYKVIITDRYHGTIFGLIANCKVIVLNSTDHKLSSGVKWFDHSMYANNVVFCNVFENIYELASEMYNSQSIIYNDKYFEKNYYDKLKDYLKNERK